MILMSQNVKFNVKSSHVRQNAIILKYVFMATKLKFKDTLKAFNDFKTKQKRSIKHKC